MTCASCGATIAAKAIVCYRCGAATAAPRPDRTQSQLRSRPAWAWLLIVVGALLFVASLWLPSESEFTRVARLAGPVLVVSGIVRLVVRRR